MLKEQTRAAWLLNQLAWMEVEFPFSRPEKQYETFVVNINKKKKVEKVFRLFDYFEVSLAPPFWISTSVRYSHSLWTLTAVKWRHNDSKRRGTGKLKIERCPSRIKGCKALFFYRRWKSRCKSQSRHANFYSECMRAVISDHKTEWDLGPRLWTQLGWKRYNLSNSKSELFIGV